MGPCVTDRPVCAPMKSALLGRHAPHFSSAFVWPWLLLPYVHWKNPGIFTNSPWSQNKEEDLPLVLAWASPPVASFAVPTATFFLGD